MEYQIRAKTDQERSGSIRPDTSWHCSGYRYKDWGVNNE